MEPEYAQLENLQHRAYEILEELSKITAHIQDDSQAKEFLKELRSFRGELHAPRPTGKRTIGQTVDSCLTHLSSLDWMVFVFGALQTILLVLLLWRMW